MKISSIGSVLLITALASCSGSSGAAQPSGTSQSLSPFQSLEGLDSYEIQEIQDRVDEFLRDTMSKAHPDTEKMIAISDQRDRWREKCNRAKDEYEKSMGF